MKLFTKYNRLNIAAGVIIFLIGSCTFYFVLHYILVRQLDETLVSEQQEITTYTKEHNKLPEIIPAPDQYIFYTPTDHIVTPSFRTTTANYDKGAIDKYREATFGVTAGGQYYLVRVDKPLEETEDLLKLIIVVTIAMIALIILTGYLINRIVISRLWKPFYETIEKVKTYDLSAQQPLDLNKESIDEFMLLNQSISSMTESIQRDYKTLKEFTGNAAHEMQTPLAIIRSKLDMLMQNETILQQSGQNIAEIEKAVARLSRLYQSLLLLIKVENRQFTLNEEVELDKLIKEKCTEYQEMAEAKNLNVHVKTIPVILRFHQHLAEIVINNLLSNAIRYNKTGGSIDINLSNNKLVISNTSDTPELDKEHIFQRFYRQERAKEEGSGLGLSIVKQICDLANYTIKYQYIDHTHIFTILFI